MNALRSGLIAGLVSISAALLLPPGLRADESAKEVAALAAALKSVTVSLAEGLAASASHGTPLSGKFEIEYGKFQLSVYTVKDGAYFEVIVDHRSGKVSKSEKITDREDLAAAKSQDNAVKRASKSLDQAVKAASQANQDYRAIDVVAMMKADKPVAKITLLKGEAVKVVMVALGSEGG